MTVLGITLYPHIVLKTKSLSVDGEDPRLKRLIEDMLETMKAHPFCVGLAAPQVGISSRIAVMDGGRARKKNSNHGELVLLNPVITAAEGELLIREGCLSLPDFTGNVKRFAKVTVEALDRDGIPQKIIAQGFEAVILQHEIDHLNGFLFLDRVSSLKSDIFRRKTY